MNASETGASGGPTMRAHWSLDPGVRFLNHGSFGATPRAVLEQQSELRARLEREPVRFFGRDYPALLEQALAALARFVGASPEQLAFVTNATAGVNTVLRSLTLAPGDELVCTDHAYDACRNALAFTAERAGARLVVARVPFPVEAEAELIAAVLSALTPRTRLVLLDHVTSPTALVFPLRQLVSVIESRGIPVLVDGAHAPGQVPVDLTALGAAYYTGNCHKWLCAPKGAGFLWARADRLAGLRPLALSHGATRPDPRRSLFRQEFDWTGTDDPTPFLCVPAAIDFLGGLYPGGWPELMQRNHGLALAARALLLARLGAARPCPDPLCGAMASVPIPDGSDPTAGDHFSRDPLQVELAARAQIQVPVFPWPAPPRRLLRISAQAYNSLDEYATLAETLALALHGA